MKNHFLPQWLVVGLIFLGSHSITAYRGYNYLESGAIAGMTLTTPAAEWANKTIPGDTGYYLRTARNVALGKGVVDSNPYVQPEAFVPFVFWAPGTPWAYGQALKLSPGLTMRACFWFVVLAQVLVGLVTLATLRLWTRSTLAFVITAFLTGFNPAVQGFYYGVYLVCSESVSSIPLAFGLFFLALGFREFWKSKRETTSWKLAPKTAWAFFLAGVSIGLASLVRDSIAQFSVFTALVLFGVCLVRMRSKWIHGLLAAVLLLSGTVAIRKPVKNWNLRRAGVKASVVASSSAGFWQYGFWTPHDAADWYVTSGIGLGDYLDRSTATRIRGEWEAGHMTPMKSLVELGKLVVKNPLRTLYFKVARLPVLLLGTQEWKNAQLTLVSGWCTLFYLLLFAYLAMHAARRSWPHEILYLYAAFIICSSVIIHSEFRYSYPVWLTLIMVPGLFFEEIRPLLMRRWKMLSRVSNGNSDQLSVTQS